MSKGKDKKVIKVDNLVIHANNVKIIQNQKHPKRDHSQDPWSNFWGRPTNVEALEDDKK